MCTVGVLDPTFQNCAPISTRTRRRVWVGFTLFLKQIRVRITDRSYRQPVAGVPLVEVAVPRRIGGPAAAIGEMVSDAIGEVCVLFTSSALL